MQRNLIFNNIIGMNMDVSPSKRLTSLAYNIRNMRITVDGDSSVLSWTNEKGTSKITLYDESSQNIARSIDGHILGSCVLNDYLVLFTKNTSANSDSLDLIYRVNFSNPEKTTIKKLYTGDLSFSEDSLFDTISVYENENILKVYWVDGINQPRFINIVATSFNSQSFSFLPSDINNETMTITKQLTTGYYKAGTVQYAFAYFNRHGALTNLCLHSSILYISGNNSGTAVDSLVGCAFTITINNLNNNFEYVRIYSYGRSSVNTTPFAYIVADIHIPPPPAGSSTSTITWVDDGSNNIAIDYSALLFMNRIPVKPSTITLKDNTLFYGNLKYDSLKDISLKEALTDLTASDLITFSLTKLESVKANAFYPHSNQLKYSQQQILGFKGNESYLFGVTFQDYNNTWSSIIKLGNVLNPTYPKVIKNGANYDIYIVQANFKAEAIDAIKTALGSLLNNYKNLKLVIAQKDEGKRNVICLGIVCPTVYSLEERVNGTLPFALSSWFFRPVLNQSATSYNKILDKLLGYAVEFSHLHSLSATNYPSTREIFLSNNAGLRVSASLEGGESINNEKWRFGVDTSIVTLHSPDIVFDDITKEVLEESTDYKFRIVGFADLSGTYSDSEMTVDRNSYTTSINNKPYVCTLNANVDKKKNSLASSTFAAGQISYTAQTFKRLSDNNNSNKAEVAQTFTIYPWHRSSTADNQKTPVDDEDYWHFPIKTKVLSNIRICSLVQYGDSAKWWEPQDDISNIGVFREGTTKLLKLKSSGLLGEVTYYGDVDTMLTGPSDQIISGEFSNVRMKYKSSSHAVFAFNGGENYYLLLPKLDANVSASCLDLTKYPEWAVASVSLATNKLVILTDTTDTDFWRYIAAGNLVKAALRLLNIAQLEDSDSASKYGTEYTYLKTLIYTDTDTNISYYDITIHAEIAAFRTLEGNTVLVYCFKYDYSQTSQELQDGSYIVDIDSNAEVVTLHPGQVIYDNSNNNKQEISTAKIKILDWFGMYGSGEEVSLENPNDYSPTTGSNLYKAEVYNGDHANSGFYIGEFYKDDNGLPLDTSEFNLLNYNWLDASNIINFKSDSPSVTIFGDTYFQRYDDLKTLALSPDDVNQIVDIASTYLETHINIDGRYDKNRGIINNNTTNSLNFNLLNKVYSQTPNTWQSYVSNDLLITSNYSNVILWSLSKNLGESIDSWTLFNSSSILNLDGDKGKLNKLLNFNGSIVAFLDSGISLILYNERAQFSDSSGVPIELANSGKVDGKRYISNTIGCQDLKAVDVGRLGVYFANNNTHKLYLFNGDGLSCLSEGAFDSYLKNKTVNKVSANYLNGDIYFNTNNESLTYNELIKLFSSFYDYYSLNSVNIKDKYLDVLDSGIYEHNTGSYNNFYNNKRGYLISIIANGDSLTDKIFNNLEFRAWEEGTTTCPFDTFSVENEFLTGSVTLTKPTLRLKFRIWRAIFPRAKYNNGENWVLSRDRIRNPWCRVTLSKGFSGDRPIINSLPKVTFHDAIVWYT